MILTPLEHAAHDSAVYDANLDNLGIAPAPRVIYSAALADYMFQNLDVITMHHENAMEHLYCEVVNPFDNKKYVVKIYPPKD